MELVERKNRRRMEALQTRVEFLKFLRRRFNGNYLKAWIGGLDEDQSMTVQVREFQRVTVFWLPSPLLSSSQKQQNYRSGDFSNTFFDRFSK